MQRYAFYRQDDSEEVHRFLASQDTCLLITQDRGAIATGIFNPLLEQGRIWLHLQMKDPQLAHLRAGAPARLVFQDILAIIPSHWVDARYAGAATTYYRFAEADVRVRIVEDPSEYSPILERWMVRYQHEGGYEPISSQSETYASKLRTIALADCSLISTETKWKLGQNKPVSVRRRVVTHLRQRGSLSDLRCADEVERWISRHAEGE